MKPIWKENDKLIYYGETSLTNPGKMHGKGILIFKEEKLLFECWFLNNQRNGKGRRITDNGSVYDG